MAKTIISLPSGDFQVIRPSWPVFCEGCWFSLNAIPCERDGESPCSDFLIDEGDLCPFGAILVPNFNPA